MVIVPVVVDAERQIDFKPIDAATRDIAPPPRPGSARHLRDDAAGRDDARSLRTDAGRGQRARARPRLLPRLLARSACSWGASSSTCAATRRSWAARARRARDARWTFYRAVLDEGTEVRAVASAEAAEMTKLAETTYRDVNIAYANELARYAARHGIDVTEVIEPANSQPYSHIHQPGVGVGGHCIPVYPHFLFNGDPELRIPPLAREINEGMGAFTVDAIEDTLGSLDGAAGARARHRLPRRRARGRLQLRLPRCATSCWPPAPGSTATTRTSTPSTCGARLRALRPRPPGADPGRRAPGRARRLPSTWIRARSPGWSCSSTGATRSTAKPYERAGIGYVGIGR